jgi:hypothetical protein
MSDNFGSGQPRVLNTEDRSLDSVVFQYKTPPLSSEWNLINQIGNQKVKDFIGSSTASGWLSAGSVKSLDKVGASESDARNGDVFTSVGYNANTFKMMSDGEGVTAIVNGWPICVKGYNYSGTDNLIELDPPTADSYRYDFVYLEVWKKLIGENDPVYPNGNVTATPYSDNELVYDVVGVETTKRVQIQYRIRSKKLDTVSNFKEGFDLGSNVYPIGGRTSEYAFPSYKFTAKGSSDPGLYISGDGSPQSQEILNTVDGYVYAIPMFMVYRRKQGSFSSGESHSTVRTRQSFLDGFRSDRVDERLLDVVYAEDIIDYRHKVLLSVSDVKELMDNTFKNLVKGTLSTNLGRGFADFSGGTYTLPGASHQLKREQISGENSLSSFKRRVYSNGAVYSPSNIIKIPVINSFWSAGTFDVSAYIPSVSVATITEILGIYEPSLGLITGASYSIIDKEIEILSGSNIVGTSSAIYLQVDLIYTAGNNGFKNVPLDFYEVNKTETNPFGIGSRSRLLRYNLTGASVNFDTVSGKDVNDGETDIRDYVLNTSNDFTESVDFGMDLTVHRPIGVTPSILTVYLTDSKLYGYYILGVKSVYENVGSVESPVWEIRSFNHVRLEEALVPPNPDEKKITGYTINITSGVSNVGAKEFKVAFSIGSKKEYYKVSTQQVIKDDLSSSKFFSVNKQARAVTDVYEMVEVVAFREGSSSYFIVDTVDKPILKLASNAIQGVDGEGGYLVGVPYVYSSSGQVIYSINVSNTADINSLLPVLNSSEYSVDTTPTRIRIEDTSASVTGNYITVPLLVSSYVSAGEQSYNFYYDFIPYQGLLDTGEVSGSFVCDSKAHISSIGSGSEANIVLGSDELIGGLAKFSVGSRYVEPVDDGDGVPNWADFLDTDLYTYYMRIAGDNLFFKVDKIPASGTRTGWIVLSQPFKEGATAPDSVGNSYEILRKDASSDCVINTIDNMPSYIYEDYKGGSVLMAVGSVSAKNFYVDALSKIQDPTNAVPGTFSLIKVGNTSRGGSDIILTEDQNDSNFSLAFKRPAIKYPSVSASNVYKKVFQPYLFLKIDADKVAKPYLAVITSGSKNDTTSTELYAYDKKDTIDLFELLGRPLIRL